MAWDCQGNAPAPAGLTLPGGQRACGLRPAGYDAGNWMGRATMGDGFVALYIFMLAAIAGNVIISRVPVILHTPLMSGSNFIHGIVLIGAMVVLGHADTTLEKVIGFAAVLLGAGNAAGGYVVTERMLDMFKSSKKPAAQPEAKP
jgi:NAD(P) transhydrogenase subunit alpha